MFQCLITNLKLCSCGSKHHNKEHFPKKYILFNFCHKLLPSSSFSFAEVSGICRLTINRWLLFTLLQGCVVAEDVTRDLQIAVALLAEVNSSVVAKHSFLASTDKESGQTSAVLRGCRSFCTAAIKERQANVSSKNSQSFMLTVLHR